MTLRLGKVGISKTTFRYVPLSPNTKMHWGVKARWTKAWQEEVFYRFMELPYKERQEHKEKLLEKKCILIELFTTSPQDEDNAMASIKGILDGLKGLLIFDDAPEYLSLRVISIKVSKKEEQGVFIHLIPTI